MKTLLTFFLSLVLVLSAYSQEDEKLTKSELKKLKKEQRKAEQAAEHGGDPPDDPVETYG